MEVFPPSTAPRFQDLCQLHNVHLCLTQQNYTLYILHRSQFLHILREIHAKNREYLKYFFIFCAYKLNDAVFRGHLYIGEHCGIVPLS